MKSSIALVGNYGHQNLGDEAILQGFLESTARTRPDVLPLLVFSDDPADTRRRVRSGLAEAVLWRRAFGGRPWRAVPVLGDVLRNVRRARHLVLAGGGLINDSNPTSLLVYAFAALVARLTNRSLHAIAVSIGPLDAAWSRVLGRFVLRSCTTVWLRDSASCQFARKLGCEAPALIPDAALAIERPAGASGRDAEGDSRRTVAISILPLGLPGSWFVADEPMYRRYLGVMREVIRELVSRERARIELLAINVRDDARAIKDLLEGLSEEVRRSVRVLGPETVGDVVTGLRRADLLIASRLHSAVLGSVAGTPFIALAYQEKVSAFVREAGLGRFVRDVHAVESEEIREMLRALEQEVEAEAAALARFSDIARATFDRRWKAWLDQFAPLVDGRLNG